MNIRTSNESDIDLLITSLALDGGSLDVASETLWRETAIESWYKLHSDLEPADGDIPTPDDIVANVGNAGPLATSTALSAFLGRWNHMMAALIAVIYEEESRALPARRLWAGERYSSAEGKDHPDWAAFVLAHFIKDMMVNPTWAQDTVSSGLAKRLGIPMDVAGFLAIGMDGRPEVSIQSGSMLLDVCSLYDALPDKWKGEHPAEPLIQAWQGLPDHEKIRRVEVDQPEERAGATWKTGDGRPGAQSRRQDMVLGGACAEGFSGTAL